MTLDRCSLIMASMLIFTALCPTSAMAQRSGGILRVHIGDSPPSLSMLEEVDAVPARVSMGIFNNLVMFDQHVAQNSMGSIVPDLATDWSWSEDGTRLTFALRQGVKWHDGTPFTARDVKCTWDLLTGVASEKLRLNPRKSWYHNLTEIRTNGDYEVTFHLARPQPAFVALLASGYSVVYPCHVTPSDMRQHPIGTGPFKFTEFKPNERVTVTRNGEYWKKDRPYLDGIEFDVIRDVSTANLAFITDKVDWTAMTIPLLRDVKSQAPQLICEVKPGGISRNLIVNRDAPPFDNPDLRRAVALSIDRKSFIDIISEGQGDIGGVMQPLPEGVWGMPPEAQKTLPGYDLDLQKNRNAARNIMHNLGYGRDKHLTLKVSTRSVPPFRDPAVILIDQLKDVFIDGELDVVETAIWYPKMYRKDFTIGLNLTGGGVDDPDQQFYENYACGAPRNYTGYCNPELERLFDQQSTEADPDKRKALVWEIERRLAEDGARPIIFYNRFAYCWQPRVKGWTMMTNSIINNWRMEDVWLDR